MIGWMIMTIDNIIVCLYLSSDLVFFPTGFSNVFPHSLQVYSQWFVPGGAAASIAMSVESIARSL